MAKSDGDKQRDVQRMEKGKPPIMSARIVELSRVYQVALEEARAKPGDEQVDEALRRARSDLEVAWLKKSCG